MNKDSCVEGTSEQSVYVQDMSGDGTGPWRLMVNGYGVATWPCKHDPKEYAEEVARSLRVAVSSWLRERARATFHGPHVVSIQFALNKAAEDWEIGKQ